MTSKLGTTLIAAYFAFAGALAAQNAVPLPARELRGSWIATVRNINWPSEPGLPVAKQKEQLLTLIDSAAKLASGRWDGVLSGEREAEGEEEGADEIEN